MGSISFALTKRSGRRNGLREGRVGIVLRQEFLDARDIDRAGDDVNAVGANVGGQRDAALDGEIVGGGRGDAGDPLLFAARLGIVTYAPDRPPQTRVGRVDRRRARRAAGAAPRL